MTGHPLTHILKFLYTKDIATIKKLADIFQSPVEIREELTLDDINFVNEQVKNLLSSIFSYFDGDLDAFMRKHVLSYFEFTKPLFSYDTKFFLLLEYQDKLRNISEIDHEKLGKLTELAKAVERVYSFPEFADALKNIRAEVETARLKREKAETEEVLLPSKAYTQTQRPRLLYPFVGTAVGLVSTIIGIISECTTKNILCKLLKYGGPTLTALSFLYLIWELSKLNKNK